MKFTAQRTFTGTKAGETISGDVGTGETINDLIVGLGGDDVLSGGAGDDLVMGGKGNDAVHGNRGVDHLFGGDGDDVVTGGREGDFLYGDFGADRLRGDNGTIVGFIDTFVFQGRSAGFASKGGAYASDVIIDFEAGIDVLRFEGFKAGTTRIYSQNADDVVVGLDTDGDGFANYALVTVLNADVADVMNAAGDGGLII